MLEVRCSRKDYWEFLIDGTARVPQCLLITKLLRNAMRELHMLLEVAMLRHHRPHWGIVQGARRCYDCEGSLSAFNLMVKFDVHCAFLHSGNVKCMCRTLLNTCYASTCRIGYRGATKKVLVPCPSDTKLPRGKRSGQYRGIEVAAPPPQNICVLLASTSYFLTSL